MRAAAELATTDRSDTRTVVTQGLKLGVLTAVAVVLFVKGSELIGPGRAAALFQVLVVFTAASLAAFLPATWVAARTADGIAAGAFVGLIGATTFSAIDIVLLRVVDLYPWQWDAIGGGSGWWYLPVWWMLGTLVAWIGGIVVAGAARLGVEGLGRLVGGALLGTAVVAGAGAVATPLGFGPVLVGGAFVVALVVRALVSLVRRA